MVIRIADKIALADNSKKVFLVSEPLHDKNLKLEERGWSAPNPIRHGRFQTLREEDLTARITLSDEYGNLLIKGQINESYGRSNVLTHHEVTHNLGRINVNEYSLLDNSTVKEYCEAMKEHLKRQLKLLKNDQRINITTIWYTNLKLPQVLDDLERYIEETYRPFFQWLLRSGLPATVSIDSPLLEGVKSLGKKELLETLVEEAENGSINLAVGASRRELVNMLPTAEFNAMLDKRLKDYLSQFDLNGYTPGSRVESIVAGYRIYDGANNGSTIPYNQVGTVKGYPMFFWSEWSERFRKAFKQAGIDQSGEVFGIKSHVALMQQEIQKWFGGGGYIVLVNNIADLARESPHEIAPILDKYATELMDRRIKPVALSNLLTLFTTRKEVNIVGYDNPLSHLIEEPYQPTPHLKIA